MSSADNPIRLDQSDLYSPRVESYLEMQRTMRRDVGEVAPQSLMLRILYSSWFYLAMASGLGAFVAWVILEPFFNEGGPQDEGFSLIHLLMFPMVAGGVGLFLGAAEGAMCRNLRRLCLCGAVGLGMGFGGGLVMLVPATIVFTIMIGIATAFCENPQPDQMPTGWALLILIMGRAAAWALASIPAGLGQGVALQEKKVAINGLIGALLGGVLGGLLFDPISIVFATPDGEASVSRAVGFVVIGLMVGLFVGLVEGWTKTAWLMMQAGPLAGKQFVLYRDTIVLGSSPKADVYLFKDDAIEPRHALIRNRGGRFEIEDCNTPDGTYVNGAPVKKQLLKAGDRIVLGKTVLEFTLREAAK